MTSFPGRPDHPDFWLLAEVVTNQDNKSENVSTKEEQLGQVADPDSLLYVAQQRALRALGPKASTGQLARMAAVWLDAFMAGAAFQAKKDSA